MQGRVHSIETFGTVDGPGIRYVIFLQGCNFRCAYCHNPDTWSCNAGTLETVESLIEDIKKYTRYIEGVTVSGGEPLLQVEFVTELFSEVKKLGLNTCIDTSGSEFGKIQRSKIEDLLTVTDLVLLDIKHIDEEKHIWLTGNTNKNVLEFSKYLSDIGKPVWLRYVLVPTINDDKETLMQWRAFADGLLNVEKVEVLPYHRLAVEKYKNLGLKYRLETTPEPTKEQLAFAKNILNKKEKN